METVLWLEQELNLFIYRYTLISPPLFGGLLFCPYKNIRETFLQVSLISSAFYIH
jgi:hypothetical protein